MNSNDFRVVVLVVGIVPRPGNGKTDGTSQFQPINVAIRQSTPVHAAELDIPIQQLLHQRGMRGLTYNKLCDITHLVLGDGLHELAIGAPVDVVQARHAAGNLTKLFVSLSFA